MTDNEWQEIVQLVTETASQTAREYIASAYRKELPAPPSTDSRRQQQIEIVRNGTGKANQTVISGK